MSACCALEPAVFYYPKPDEEAEKKKPSLPGNVCIELYFDLTAMISQEILKILLSQEMSDKELIEAAEKTGTFQFWNNPQDDVYNRLL
jgi:hypothetical protein